MRTRRFATKTAPLPTLVAALPLSVLLSFTGCLGTDTKDPPPPTDPTSTASLPPTTSRPAMGSLPTARAAPASSGAARESHFSDAGFLGATTTASTIPGAAALSTPVPLVSLKVPSGNVVEFYDFGRGALVSEVGAAYTAPAIKPGHQQITADRLVDLWRELSPETAVPQALTDLQNRLMNLPPRSDRRVVEGTPTPEFGGLLVPETPLVTGDDLLASPDGCNNGCCDFDWLSTFYECQVQNYPYTWFLFNYGYSYVNTSDDAIIYHGLVCSAQGTSTYHVNISGAGGTWSVAEATYRTFQWSAGYDFFLGWDEQPINSDVNSSSNMHLHTYCGHVAWD